MTTTTTGIDWTNSIFGGTSLRGYYEGSRYSFEETVARLKTLSEQDPLENADGDKTSVEFTGRFNGSVFTLYDYKGDRTLHIGGTHQLDLVGLIAALDVALQTVEPSPYEAVEPDEYGSGRHGWPQKG